MEKASKWMQDHKFITIGVIALVVLSLFSYVGLESELKSDADNQTEKTTQKIDIAEGEDAFTEYVDENYPLVSLSSYNPTKDMLSTSFRITGAKIADLKEYCKTMPQYILDNFDNVSSIDIHYYVYGNNPGSARCNFKVVDGELEPDGEFFDERIDENE